MSRGGKRDREAREARAEGEGAFERAGGAPLAAVELEVGVVEAMAASSELLEETDRPMKDGPAASWPPAELCTCTRQATDSLGHITQQIQHHIDCSTLDDFCCGSPGTSGSTWRRPAEAGQHHGAVDSASLARPRSLH